MFVVPVSRCPLTLADDRFALVKPCGRRATVELFAVGLEGGAQAGRVPKGARVNASLTISIESDA
jgi:hypothetical protein